MDYKIKLGVAPTRRGIFNKENAFKYKELTKKKLDELAVDYVDIDDINDEGLLYSMDDVEKMPGVPLLLVNLSVMKSQSGVYAYSLDLELYQVVMLMRDDGEPSLARTWSEGVIGVTNSGNIKQLSDRVGSLVDEFCGDFMVANIDLQQG